MPYTPPNPIEDPKELIESIERFYRMVKAGITPGGWSQGVDYMGVDLGAIKDERVRQEALEIFHRMKGSWYVLSKNPEMKDTIVLPSIQRLIDYLKAESQ